MKTQKNNIYFKKINFLLFKFCLWVGIGLIFVNFSFLIPICSENKIKDLIVFFLLVIVVNIHTYYLYPTISKKSNVLYIISLIGSVFLCSLFEILISLEIFDPAYYTFLNKKQMCIVTLGAISIRNLALFAFFLWMEHFYRLILFLYKKDIIQQKEISLLIEKQDFEKQFSRKKLLPHYFFNILELIPVETSADNNNNELLNKIKFILYYFLVDAEQDKVELEKEVAFYKYYIELENLKHKQNIIVNFNVFGAVESYFIIPLLFEPLIGNAMKYTKKDGTGYVDINIDTTLFPILRFYCKNNYSPCSSNIVSSECGLKILEQRLDLCYKNNYTLNINQGIDSYEVVLSINLE